MSMKALLGTLLALVLAVGGTAFLVARSVQPEPPPAPKPEAGEIVYQNPFDLKAPGPHPKVVVPESHFEFGVMSLGGEQSHEFEIRNEGDAPLKLAKGKILCKCTIPTLDTGAIPPGGSTKVQLTWKPTAAEKEFRKEADIWTNDPKIPMIKFSIRGSVYGDPEVTPGEFGVGVIPRDKENLSQVVIYSPVSDDLAITGYETNDPKAYELTWAKLTSEELMARFHDRTPKPLVGYSLELKTKPNGTIGVFNGWVKLKVNRNDGEQKISISGMRVGLMELHGPAYQSALALVDLSRFKAVEGGKTTMFVRLEPFGEDLKLVDVQSQSGHLGATLAKRPSSGAKDIYDLVIQAKAGTPPGTTFTADNPDKLTLKTNHPEVPELSFNVRYIAQ
jgi:hypothetical protein